MAHGYYPLDRNDGAGLRLANIATELRALLRSTNSWSDPMALPSASDNVPEDAATDGGYETRLKIALDLIEQCLEPSHADS